MTRHMYENIWKMAFVDHCTGYATAHSHSCYQSNDKLFECSFIVRGKLMQTGKLASII